MTQSSGNSAEVRVLDCRGVSSDPDVAAIYCVALSNGSLSRLWLCCLEKDGGGVLSRHMQALHSKNIVPSGSLFLLSDPGSPSLLIASFLHHQSLDLAG